LPETTVTSADEKATAVTPAHEEPETAFESLSSICTVLAVGLFVMTFIFQNFEIPSASMEKTLLIGDHVLVDRITLAPPTHWAPFVHYRDVRRGDVIVFHKPVPEPDGTYIDFLVKRCIGIPGDHIRLRDGVVFLNGVAQNEPYAQQPTSGDAGQNGIVPYRDDFPSVPVDPNDPNVTAKWAVDLPNHLVDGDLVVPPGFVFAMGDNRTKSLDGRYWGFVPRENIVGRPMFVYWSFETPANQMNKTAIGDRIAFMGHVLVHIFDETRWSRTLHVVR
jgi:signal peptidase I